MVFGLRGRGYAHGGKAHRTKDSVCRFVVEEGLLVDLPIKAGPAFHAGTTSQATESIASYKVHELPGELVFLWIVPA